LPSTSAAEIMDGKTEQHSNNFTFMNVSTSTVLEIPEERTLQK
jgi:hypothetical protein